MSKILINPRSIHLLRILLSGIFLVAGSNHLLNTRETVNRLEQARFKGMAYFFGDPKWLIILSGILMLLAGFLFLIGFRTKWAAITLIFILIPITFSVQVGQINTLGPLFKNIAILGGLIFFVMNDTDQLSKIK